MDTALSQSAALLTQVLAHELSASCSLEQIEQLAHRRAQQIARTAVEQYGQTVVAQAEQQRAPCSCGAFPVAKQRRTRSLLVLAGLIRLRLRRYRCPQCGAWHCPGQAALRLRPKQRMTRSVEELLCRFGLSWGYVLAARLVATVLPGVSVSGKTVERAVSRCATAVSVREDQAAVAAATDEHPVGQTGAPFTHPSRIYVGLDGVLVRARKAKGWVEVQVGSLWSAWRELPDRTHPRRQITDATVVARAQGWEALGRQVWREFVQRGGAALRQTEIVVLCDGASGIRSLWELQFGEALAILDPWHLWEKVKERSRQVLGKGEAARQACQVVYEALKEGAVTQAQEWVQEWPAGTARAQKWQERLIGYLERNREIIRDTFGPAGARVHGGVGVNGESQRLGGGAADEEWEDALECERGQCGGAAACVRDQSARGGVPTDVTCFDPPSLHLTALPRSRKLEHRRARRVRRSFCAGAARQSGACLEK
jgi:hypothetical protein